ncbi:MAG: tail fiber domain-containing protein [bacterium]
MKYHITLTLALLLVFVLASAALRADTPTAISYQGYLTNTAGNPLDTMVDMRFRIYDAAVGGAVVWDETQVAVVVVDGGFTVALGSVAPITDVVFQDVDRWLGIQVGADPEISPRTKLLTVPYALRVSTVDGAGGGAVTGDLTVTGAGTFGIGNNNPNNTSFVAGYDNSCTASYSVVFGCENSVSQYRSGVGSGYSNTVNSMYSFIGGGFGNVASGAACVVAGGDGCSATGRHSAVGGGAGNHSTDTSAAVAGGRGNSATGFGAFIGGGVENYVGGRASAVLGGYRDTIVDTADYSYLFGIDSKLEDDSTLLIEMPHIVFGSVAKGSRYEFPDGDGSADQVMKTDGAGQLSWTTITGGGDADWQVDGANVNMWSLPTGNVGIGANPPQNKLHVAGNLYVEEKAKIGLNNSNPGAFTLVVGSGCNANGNRSTVCGGSFNATNGEESTVGGGNTNIANGLQSAVGGGSNNTAVGSRSAIGGGDQNEVNGNLSFIGGGQGNGTVDEYTAIGGGQANTTGGMGSTVGGGSTNWTDGLYAFIGGGLENQANADYTTISGGRTNLALSNYSAVAGGQTNLALGLHSFVGGGKNNQASVDFSTVAGGEQNAAGGGGAGQHSTICGGKSNLTLGNSSVVAGGELNAANAHFSNCGGGWGNTSSGFYSTVSGGSENTASGQNAIAAGGWNNVAGGNYSFAAGQGANASTPGTFVWGSGGMTSTAANQFLIQASGHCGINVNDPSEDIDVLGDARLRGLPLTYDELPYVVADPTGKLWKFAYYKSSQRYKDNIRELGVDVDQIFRLEPVKFNWKETGREDVGLIAEEVEKLIPELVKYDDEGRVDGVRYDKVVIYLLSALKSLKAENDQLKAQQSDTQVQMAELRAMIEVILARQNQAAGSAYGLADSNQPQGR